MIPEIWDFALLFASFGVGFGIGYGANRLVAERGRAAEFDRRNSEYDLQTDEYNRRVLQWDEAMARSTEEQ